MEAFWPKLPYVIPASQGQPLWWDIAWWIFQIVIMVVIVALITRWATRVDKLMASEFDMKRTTSSDASHHAES